MKFAKLAELVAHIHFAQGNFIRVKSVAERKVYRRNMCRRSGGKLAQRIMVDARCACVVFLQLHLRIAKDNRLVLFELLHLFLACQVFALHVGTHLAQEFLFVKCFLQYIRQSVFCLAVFERDLVLDVLKMEKSVLGSFGGGIDAPVVFLGSFLGLGVGVGVSGSGVVGVSAHVDTLFFLLSAFNTMVLFHFNFLFAENRTQNRKIGK